MKGKIIKFEIGVGSQGWEGYKISVIPKKIKEPGECLECKKWFKNGQEVHPVIENCTRVWYEKPQDQYYANARTSLYLDSSTIGYLCEKCFHKAVSKGQFRYGKIRKNIRQDRGVR